MNCRPIERRAAVIWPESQYMAQYWNEQQQQKDETYKHVDGHFSVDMVHVNVAVKAGKSIYHQTREGHKQFIQTADGGSHGFPESQQQTDL